MIIQIYQFLNEHDINFHQYCTLSFYQQEQLSSSSSSSDYCLIVPNDQNHDQIQQIINKKQLELDHQQILYSTLLTINQHYQLYILLLTKDSYVIQSFHITKDQLDEINNVISQLLQHLDTSIWYILLKLIQNLFSTKCLPSITKSIKLKEVKEKKPKVKGEEAEVEPEVKVKEAEEEEEEVNALSCTIEHLSLIEKLFDIGLYQIEAKEFYQFLKNLL